MLLDLIFKVFSLTHMAFPALFLCLRQQAVTYRGGRAAAGARMHYWKTVHTSKHANTEKFLPC